MQQTNKFKFNIKQNTAVTATGYPHYMCARVREVNVSYIQLKDDLNLPCSSTCLLLLLSGEAQDLHLVPKDPIALPM